MYLFLCAGTDTGWMDTGFPIGAGANSGGGPTYKLARFSRETKGIKLGLTQVRLNQFWYRNSI